MSDGTERTKGHIDTPTPRVARSDATGYGGRGVRPSIESTTEGSAMDRVDSLRAARTVGAVLAAMVLVSVMATGVSADNNGTLKIHEQGTPLGTENNDPQVCQFDVEAFGLDAGQTGYLVFSSQGGDGPVIPDVGPFVFGPANGDGYAIFGTVGLPAGHYEATLYGKGDLTDVKAKSKVFKVTCTDGGGGGGGG